MHNFTLLGYQYSLPALDGMLLFMIAGFVGMAVGYYRRWSYKSSEPFTEYAFGDMHAFGRAITTLLLMCMGAGGLEYLEAMTDMQILIAGAGIGFTVPEKAELRKDDHGKE
jgi:hypothetical protein